MTRHVDADLHTGWDNAPTLTVVNRRDDTTTLVLEFATTPRTRWRSAC